MYSGITDIDLPEGLITIGEGAFDGASNLVAVNIPSTVTDIGLLAFSSTGITNIEIPSSVTTLKTQTFFCCGYLKSVKIPVSVTSLQNVPFYECNSLTDVYYEGTEQQWNAIERTYSDNYDYDSLLNATIHYNSK